MDRKNRGRRFFFADCMKIFRSLFAKQHP